MAEAPANAFIVEELLDDQSPFVQLSPARMSALSILIETYVVIEGQRSRDTVCIAVPSDDQSEDSIRLSMIVSNNIGVAVGDTVRVFPFGYIPKGARIRVLPMEDVFEGYVGNIIATYLTPYFSKGYRPIRQNDRFSIGSGFGPIEFKVIETSPGEAVIVTPQTRIECEDNPQLRSAEQTLSTFEGSWTPLIRNVALFIHTSEGKLKVEVSGSETLAGVKRLHAPAGFLGAITANETTYEDDDVPVIVFAQGTIIRFVPRLALTLVTVSGSRFAVSVLANQPVSTLRKTAGKELLPSDVFYCSGSRLDEAASFDFQSVQTDCEIKAVRQIALTVATPNGHVTLSSSSEDSFAKVKCDTIVRSKCSLKSEYQLKLGSEVLLEKTKVEALPPSTVLTLVALRPKPPVSLSVAAVSFALEEIVPNLPVIPTDVPLKKLRKRGFDSRNIFDPVLFYSLFLQYGSIEDSQFLCAENDVLSLEIEVVSWGNLSVDVTAGDSVLSLKQRVEREIKITCANQTLLFSGKTLADGDTLLACGLVDGSRLRLICTGPNSYFLIPTERFDSAGDRDYTGYKSPPDFGNRGGEEYIPPCGWRRYGLKVTGLFESDTWLGMCNGPGEWIVSYHGTSMMSAKSIITGSGYDLSKGRYFRYGKGIYSALRIESAEVYCANITWEGRRFHVAFMNRINPDPEKLKRVPEMGYFVSYSDRDIRPYGLLVKEI